MANPDPSKGPQCGRCSSTEARCAYEYPCCENCTHFLTDPDAEIPNMVRMFTCKDCGNDFEGPAQGPQRRYCDECRYVPKKPYGPRNVPKPVLTLVPPIPMPEYAWHIAESGLAHAWRLPNARISRCGIVKIDKRGGEMPSGWSEKDICKKCKTILEHEEERFAS